MNEPEIHEKSFVNFGSRSRSPIFYPRELDHEKVHKAGFREQVHELFMNWELFAVSTVS